MAPHIPDELLLQIFSHLNQWESNSWEELYVFRDLDRQGQRTLASLCLCSRRFRAIAQPILYQIFVKSENLYDRMQSSSSSYATTHYPNDSLRRYLRTLLERPDLAAQVKTVQVRAWETENTLTDENMWPGEAAEVNARPMPPSYDMARSFYAAASKFLPEGEDRSAWQVALCRGDEDAEVALLLALLPNMETLQIVFPNVGMDEYSFFSIHAVIRRALETYKDSTMHMFSHLRVLEARSFWIEESDLGLPTYPFSDLFQLPSLETFIGHHVIVESDPEEWGEWSCPPAISQLRDLLIQDSLISSWAITTLLRSCANLKTLKITFHDGGNSGLEYDWSEVGEALRVYHHATLESLFIDILDDSNLMGPSPLGSLGSFTMLNDLQLYQSAFLGDSAIDEEDGEHEIFAFVSVLPQSLSSLTILGATPKIYTPLEALAKDLGQFSRLRKLRVHDNEYYDHEEPTSDEELRRIERVAYIKELFEARGVDWTHVPRVSEAVETDD